MRHRLSERARTGRCLHGHAMTPDNAYHGPDGYDRCRACDRERNRERRRRARARERGRVASLRLQVGGVKGTIVRVRCDACAGVFADTLGGAAPCPYCKRLARGAA